MSRYLSHLWLSITVLILGCGGGVGTPCESTDACKAGLVCAGSKTAAYICVDPESAKCRRAAKCGRKGVCTANKDGKCVVVSDEDCSASLACKNEGLCAHGDAKCIAKNDKHCARTKDCEQYGMCVAQGGRCGADEKSCKASDGCREHGLCAAKQGVCQVSSEGCEQSEGCKKDGKCSVTTAYRPTRFGTSETCAPRSEKDCQESRACKESGLCFFGLPNSERERANMRERCRARGQAWDSCKRRFEQCLAAKPKATPPVKAQEEEEAPKRDGKLVDKVRDVSIHDTSLAAWAPHIDPKDAEILQRFDGLLFSPSADEPHSFGTFRSSKLRVGAGGGGFGSAGLGGVKGVGNGKGKGEKHIRQFSLPAIVFGRPIVSGSYDKEIVYRIMKRARRKFLYCYKRELEKRQALIGRVGVKFVIGPDGNVFSSTVNPDPKVTTIKNRTVEKCIARQVKRLKFPSPKGGGTVRVNYDLLLKML